METNDDYNCNPQPITAAVVCPVKDVDWYWRRCHCALRFLVSHTYIIRGKSRLLHLISHLRTISIKPSSKMVSLYLQVFIIALLFSLAQALPTRGDVLECLTARNVTFAVKTSENWTALSRPYNLRLVYDPAVITIPATPDQVSSSVTCAAAAGLKVQAKGGGHSYASYSSGGQNGSLIVDMEKFSDIEVDQSELLPAFPRNGN